YAMDPDRLVWFLRPCRLRVLLVADGSVDFSRDDRGLATLIETLRTMPGSHVRFEITIAHIGDATDEAVMMGQPGIARSIKRFRFDDPAHFTPAMYDEVWLFGMPYPSARLSDEELHALREFMNGGRGLFATEEVVFAAEEILQARWAAPVSSSASTPLSRRPCRSAANGSARRE
ncbi:MAG: hypothetical protein ACRETT_07905, partial [Steroidobacteraceae bacterium]